MRIRVNSAALFPAAVFMVLTAWPAYAKNSNTDIQVSSADIDLLINQKKEPKDKFGIPLDNETTLGFNQDGDPSVLRSW